MVVFLESTTAPMRPVSKTHLLVIFFGHKLLGRGRERTCRAGYAVGYAYLHNSVCTHEQLQ